MTRRQTKGLRNIGTRMIGMAACEAALLLTEAAGAVFPSWRSAGWRADISRGHDSGKPIRNSPIFCSLLYKAPKKGETSKEKFRLLAGVWR